MTVSLDRKRIVVADLDEAFEVVRRGGLRLTAARRLVLVALFSASEPISAEEIARGCGGSLLPSDIASVYRNLEVLGQLGLVRHFHVGHSHGRYVLERSVEYDYLGCESCGALKSVDRDDLSSVRETVLELSGFEARFSHFPILGLCRQCRRHRDRK